MAIRHDGVTLLPEMPGPGPEPDKVIWEIAVVVKEPTKRVLWTNAGGICSFPFCYLRCDVSATLEGDNTSTIGTVAHIVSAKNGGPRSDHRFPRTEIDDLGNLILLCPNHHKLVDAQQKTYSAERLRRWKKEHESRVQQLGTSYVREASRGLRTALEKCGGFCAYCKCRCQISPLTPDTLFNTVVLIEISSLPDLTYGNLIVFCPKHKTKVQANREDYSTPICRSVRGKFLR